MWARPSVASMMISLWRLMEKREVWETIADDQTGEPRMNPAIYLSYWRIKEGVRPGVGRVMGFIYTLHDYTFSQHWKIRGLEHLLLPCVAGHQIVDVNFLLLAVAMDWLCAVPGGWGSRGCRSSPSRSRIFGPGTQTPRPGLLPPSFKCAASEIFSNSISS